LNSWARFKKAVVSVCVIVGIGAVSLLSYQPVYGYSYGGLGPHATKYEIATFLKFFGMSMAQYLNPNEATIFKKQHGTTETQALKNVLYGFAIGEKTRLHITPTMLNTIYEISRMGGVRAVTAKEAMSDLKFAEIVALSDSVGLTYTSSLVPVAKDLPVISDIVLFTNGTPNLYVDINFAHNPVNASWKRAFGSFAIVFSYFFDETMFGRQNVTGALGVPRLPFPIFKKSNSSNTLYSPVMVNAKFPDGVRFSGSYVDNGKYGYSAVVESTAVSPPFLSGMNNNSLVGILHSWVSIYSKVPW